MSNEAPIDILPYNPMDHINYFTAQDRGGQKLKGRMDEEKEEIGVRVAQAQPEPLPRAVPVPTEQSRLPFADKKMSFEEFKVAVSKAFSESVSDEDAIGLIRKLESEIKTKYIVFRYGDFYYLCKRENDQINLKFFKDYNAFQEYFQSKNPSVDIKQNLSKINNSVGFIQHGKFATIQSVIGFGDSPAVTTYGGKLGQKETSFSGIPQDVQYAMSAAAFQGDAQAKKKELQDAIHRLNFPLDPKTSEENQHYRLTKEEKNAETLAKKLFEEGNTLLASGKSVKAEDKFNDGLACLLFLKAGKESSADLAGLESSKEEINRDYLFELNGVIEKMNADPAGKDQLPRAFDLLLVALNNKSSVVREEAAKMVSEYANLMPADQKLKASEIMQTRFPIEQFSVQTAMRTALDKLGATAETEFVRINNREVDGIVVSSVVLSVGFEKKEVQIQLSLIMDYTRSGSAADITDLVSVDQDAANSKIVQILKSQGKVADAEVSKVFTRILELAKEKDAEGQFDPNQRIRDARNKSELAVSKSKDSEKLQVLLDRVTEAEKKGAATGELVYAYHQVRMVALGLKKENEAVAYLDTQFGKQVVAKAEAKGAADELQLEGEKEKPLSALSLDKLTAKYNILVEQLAIKLRVNIANYTTTGDLFVACLSNLETNYPKGKDMPSDVRLLLKDVSAVSKEITSKKGTAQAAKPDQAKKQSLVDIELLANYTAINDLYLFVSDLTRSKNLGGIVLTLPTNHSEAEAVVNETERQITALNTNGIGILSDQQAKYTTLHSRYIEARRALGISKVQVEKLAQAEKASLVPGAVEATLQFAIEDSFVQIRCMEKEKELYFRSISFTDIAHYLSKPEELRSYLRTKISEYFLANIPPERIEANVTAAMRIINENKSTIVKTAREKQEDEQKLSMKCSFDAEKGVLKFAFLLGNEERYVRDIDAVSIAETIDAASRVDKKREDMEDRLRTGLRKSRDNFSDPKLRDKFTDAFIAESAKQAVQFMIDNRVQILAIAAKAKGAEPTAPVATVGAFKLLPIEEYNKITDPSLKYNYLLGAINYCNENNQVAGLITHINLLTQLDKTSKLNGNEREQAITQVALIFQRTSNKYIAINSMNCISQLASESGQDRKTAVGKMFIKKTQETFKGDAEVERLLASNLKKIDFKPVPAEAEAPKAAPPTTAPPTTAPPTEELATAPPIEELYSKYKDAVNRLAKELGITPGTYPNTEELVAACTEILKSRYGRNAEGAVTTPETARNITDMLTEIHTLSVEIIKRNEAGEVSLSGEPIGYGPPDAASVAQKKVAIKAFLAARQDEFGTIFDALSKSATPEDIYDLLANGQIILLFNFFKDHPIVSSNKEQTKLFQELFNLAVALNLATEFSDYGLSAFGKTAEELKTYLKKEGLYYYVKYDKSGKKVHTKDGKEVITYRDRSKDENWKLVYGLAVDGKYGPRSKKAVGIIQTISDDFLVLGQRVRSGEIKRTKEGFDPEYERALLAYDFLRLVEAWVRADSIEYFRVLADVSLGYRTDGDKVFTTRAGVINDLKLSAEEKKLFEEQVRTLAQYSEVFMTLFHSGTTVQLSKNSALYKENVKKDARSGDPKKGFKDKKLGVDTLGRFTIYMLLLAMQMKRRHEKPVSIPFVIIPQKTTPKIMNISGEVTVEIDGRDWLSEVKNLRDERGNPLYSRVEKYTWVLSEVHPDGKLFVASAAAQREGYRGFYAYADTKKSEKAEVVQLDGSTKEMKVIYLYRFDAKKLDTARFTEERLGRMFWVEGKGEQKGRWELDRFYRPAGKSEYDVLRYVGIDTASPIVRTPAAPFYAGEELKQIIPNTNVFVTPKTE